MTSESILARSKNLDEMLVALSSKFTLLRAKVRTTLISAETLEDAEEKTIVDCQSRMNVSSSEVSVNRGSDSTNASYVGKSVQSAVDITFKPPEIEVPSSQKASDFLLKPQPAVPPSQTSNFLPPEDRPHILHKTSISCNSKSQASILGVDKFQAVEYLLFFTITTYLMP